MMDGLRKMFKDQNCLEMAKLQYLHAREGTTLSTPYRKAFLCDGTFVACQSDFTFFYRPHLHENGVTTRQINPCPLSERKMIPCRIHQATLGTLITTMTTEPQYKSVTWHDKHVDLISWITTERTSLMWVLLLEQKDKNNCWHTCDKSPSVNTEVRLCASVLSLEPLFRHWTCRNHEIAVLSAPASRALKVFLDEDIITSQTVSNLMRCSSTPFSRLVDHASQTNPISLEARNLFNYMLSLVDADLRLQMESVTACVSELHVENSETYPSFHTLQKEDNLYLVRNVMSTRNGNDLLVHQPLCVLSKSVL